MKKSLIALAVLAASGAAMAQSSVTLFGVVDATVRYTDGGNGSRWQLTNSGYNSSRLGFRGTEDLGGGLSASFWLEAGVNNDNGTGSATSTNNTLAGSGSSNTGTQGLTFNRRSTVSLAGTWGEVRLGRDYVPYFYNMTVFDPFGTNGVGNALNMQLAGMNIITGGALNTTSAGVRASNSIGYFMPNIAGFYGQAMLAMGENNDKTSTGLSNPNKSDGNVGSVRAGYANGPFDIAVGWGQTTFAPQQQYYVTNVGASWNFGVAKAMFQWNQEAGDTCTTLACTSFTTVRSNTYLLGATMPLGAGELKGSYMWGNSTNDGLDGSQIALGYVYNLSKRTALYTTYAYINNDGKSFVYAMDPANAALKKSQWGLDFGVRHSF
jgi:predicted porin